MLLSEIVLYTKYSSLRFRYQPAANDLDWISFVIVADDASANDDRRYLQNLLLMLVFRRHYCRMILSPHLILSVVAADFGAAAIIDSDVSTVSTDVAEKKINAVKM